ncbi:ketoacyl-ACP synthase III family protein [Nocardia concava]|uniref:ketoacyl-ACP synthase III family protein n=1 Tax=Nocardia concava TaxID=257281 RepID=UPI001427D2F8|nr:ketoacyl-ACP synthase III family protein [Nocardia concava]
MSSSESAPEMAAHAALQVMRAIGDTVAEVGMLIHACGWDQQHLAVPLFVQDVLGVEIPMAFEIRQGCAAGLTALALAANELCRATTPETVLVTAADRFIEPAFDRWRSASGMIHGDAGASALLSRTGGFAKIIAYSANSAPEYEIAGRMDALTGAPGATLNALAVKNAIIARTGRDAFIAEMAKRTSDTISEVLDAAAVELSRIDHIVVPNMGRRTLESFFFSPLGADWDKSTWAFGRTVGHAGAADTILGLHHLAQSGALEPGQRVLAFAIGTGFCWSSAIFEIAETPRPRR